jgi:hypothetical protein
MALFVSVLLSCLYPFYTLSFLFLNRSTLYSSLEHTIPFDNIKVSLHLWKTLTGFRVIISQHGAHIAHRCSCCDCRGVFHKLYQQYEEEPIASRSTEAARP